MSSYARVKKYRELNRKAKDNCDNAVVKVARTDIDVNSDTVLNECASTSNNSATANVSPDNIPPILENFMEIQCNPADESNETESPVCSVNCSEELAVSDHESSRTTSNSSANDINDVTADQHVNSTCSSVSDNMDDDQGENFGNISPEAVDTLKNEIAKVRSEEHRYPESQSAIRSAVTISKRGVCRHP